MLARIRSSRRTLQRQTGALRWDIVILHTRLYHRSMMNRWRMFVVAWACALPLGLMGCSDDPVMSADGGNGGNGATGGSGTGGTGGGGNVDNGSATLTIGDETWEFGEFGCAFGYEATQTQVYSFSSSAVGNSEGASVQLQAEIMDDTGQERFEGEGVLYMVYIQDFENFDDPTVDWEARGPADVVVVNIDGDDVTAEGVFDDLRTAEIEQVPGTLTATCGAQSIR